VLNSPFAHPFACELLVLQTSVDASESVEKRMARTATRIHISSLSFYMPTRGNRTPVDLISPRMATLLSGNQEVTVIMSPGLENAVPTGSLSPLISLPESCFKPLVAQMQSHSHTQILLYCHQPKDSPRPLRKTVLYGCNFL